MAIRNYEDFVLIADDVEVDENGRVKSFRVHVFDSPAGQGETEETVTVPAELYKQMRWLEQRDLDSNVDQQMDVGEILASLLLPHDARKLFTESLKRIGDDEGLRLRLRLADELGSFPWEYMYIHDHRGERTSGGFLLLDTRISIARHEAIALPGDWFKAPGKRRVVVAMATPEPHDRYRKLSSLPVEQKALRAVLQEVAGIEPHFVPIYKDSQNGKIAGVTSKDLLFALIPRTDVFHFSGHGDFIDGIGAGLSNKSSGSIVLADESNFAVKLPADSLAELLGSKGIRLVVLGACETGRRDGQNVWSSVVASLLRAGIPAVVAMQYRINDSLAAAFSGAFYRALVAGLWIDEAVAVGRLAIRGQALEDKCKDIRDWGVPVLYLRANGGAVFNPVSDVHAVQEANDKLTNLISQEVREVSVVGRMIGAAIGDLRSGSVEVSQKIRESAKGVVIGGYAFNVTDGRLVVRQEADVVEGTMIGAVLGRVGPSEGLADEKEAIAKLEQLLQIEATAVKDDANIDAAADSATDDFRGVTAAVAYCQQCGAWNAENAQFCSNCGTSLSSALSDENDQDAELASE